MRRLFQFLTLPALALAVLALAARPATAETLRCAVSVESELGTMYLGVIQEDGAAPKVDWAGLHLKGGNAAKPNINVYFSLPDSSRPTLGAPTRISVGAMVDVDTTDPRKLIFQLRIDGTSWQKVHDGALMAPIPLGAPPPTRDRFYMELPVASQENPAGLKAFGKGRTIGARVGYDGGGEFGDRTLPLPSMASLQPLADQAFAKARGLLAGPQHGCDWMPVILSM